MLLRFPLSTSPCLLQLTVPAQALNALRQIVVRTCGASLRFMRIEVRDHGQTVRAWLCLASGCVGQVMAEVLHGLPEAEFGRVRRLARRAS